MSKPRVLIQLDSDRHPSSFDALVAIDAGVERLLQYGQVQPDEVAGLVHGAIFTRSPQELACTALFIGGADVTRGEAILAAVQQAFVGPLRVSVLLDANGANTTAAAAVLAAARHADLAGATAVVLAGTGPVGQRVARLLARQGAVVRLVSRSLDRAEQACQRIRQTVPQARIEPAACSDPASAGTLLSGAHILVAAGAAGVQLASEASWTAIPTLRVAIDLNAVPPAGIAGIEPADKARQRGQVICYGAIGVGGTKMKIHRAAIQRLFTANHLVLDAEEVLAIGHELGLS
jgi:threonine dehydrogenase-like Zn-dependent dehydrogenase